eukprot:scaffold7105_cov116-Isochrysis_galbana.AAC.2
MAAAALAALAGAPPGPINAAWSTDSVSPQSDPGLATPAPTPKIPSLAVPLSRTENSRPPSILSVRFGQPDSPTTPHAPSSGRGEISSLSNGRAGRARRPDTAQAGANSVVANSVVADSVVANSVVADSVVANSVVVNSVVANSAVANSAVQRGASPLGSSSADRPLVAFRGGCSACPPPHPAPGGCAAPPAKLPSTSPRPAQSKPPPEALHAAFSHTDATAGSHGLHRLQLPPHALWPDSVRPRVSTSSSSSGSSSPKSRVGVPAAFASTKWGPASSSPSREPRPSSSLDPLPLSPSLPVSLKLPPSLSLSPSLGDAPPSALGPKAPTAESNSDPHRAHRASTCTTVPCGIGPADTAGTAPEAGWPGRHPSAPGACPPWSLGPEPRHPAGSARRVCCAAAERRAAGRRREPGARESSWAGSAPPSTGWRTSPSPERPSCLQTDKGLAGPRAATERRRMQWPPS